MKKQRKQTYEAPEVMVVEAYLATDYLQDAVIASEIEKSKVVNPEFEWGDYEGQN